MTKFSTGKPIDVSDSQTSQSVGETIKSNNKNSNSIYFFFKPQIGRFDIQFYKWSWTFPPPSPTQKFLNVFLSLIFLQLFWAFCFFSGEDSLYLCPETSWLENQCLSNHLRNPNHSWWAFSVFPNSFLWCVYWWVKSKNQDEGAAFCGTSVTPTLSGPVLSSFRRGGISEKNRVTGLLQCRP